MRRTATSTSLATTAQSNDKPKPRRHFVRKDLLYGLLAEPDPDVPASHPLSTKTYAQDFDLSATCAMIRSDYDRAGDPRIQIKVFPQYIVASLRRAVRKARVPRGAAAVALVARGLDELELSPLATEYQDLIDRVDDADDLDPEHQIELDNMLHRLDYTPRADHGGVMYWGYRCSSEFRNDVAYAANQLGTTIFTISTVAIALGLHDLPGVHYKCADSMDSVVTAFFNALRHKINDVNSRFVDYQAQARRNAKKVAQFPKPVDDSGGDDD